MSRLDVLFVLLVVVSGCFSQDAPHEGPTSQVAATPPQTTAPPSVTPPPVLYKDASTGSHGPLDMVSYKGVDGTILTGEIEDGVVKTPVMTITDDVGITLLSYSRQGVPGRGEIDMTIFYREGYVLMGINGTDTGYRLRYDEWKGLEDYLLVLDNPGSPTFARDILERP